MQRALALPILALLAACSDEPVRAPQLPAIEHYTAAPVATPAAGADVPGGQAQQFVSGKDVPAQWWTLFHSPSLDRLVREALEGSPTIAQASAKLREAEEDLGVRTDTTTWPKVDGKLSANRVDLQPQALGAPALPVAFPLNLYLASVSVSYTFDLFGAERNELASLRSVVDYQRYELEAARLMLAGNVVTAAIREASLRQQIADTREMIELQARQVAIAEQMEAAGGVSHADVVSRRADLAKARSALPDLQRSLQQMRHRLAVYTGRAPEAPDLPEFALAELQLPTELPLSLPSELTRQRPDIRAAEALLQAAAAKVGVASANRYPQITLSANLGSLATQGDKLFTGGSGFYLLGASLVQPIFHGGELEAKRRHEVAAYDQAGAAYQDAVLKGLQDVADTLRALESDAGKLEQRAEAARQAGDFERITSARHDAGGVSQLALLDARRQLQNARIEQTQAAADRYADSAALLQALGGGWWNEEKAPPAPAKQKAR